MVLYSKNHAVKVVDGLYSKNHAVKVVDGLYSKNHAVKVVDGLFFRGEIKNYFLAKRSSLTHPGNFKVI